VSGDSPCHQRACFVVAGDRDVTRPRMPARDREFVSAPRHDIVAGPNGVGQRGCRESASWPPGGKASTAVAFASTKAANSRARSPQRHVPHPDEGTTVEMVCGPARWARSAMMSVDTRWSTASFIASRSVAHHGGQAPVRPRGSRARQHAAWRCSRRAESSRLAVDSTSPSETAAPAYALDDRAGQAGRPHGHETK